MIRPYLWFTLWFCRTPPRNGLRLPPLQRRGIEKSGPDTPPEEGNCRVQNGQAVVHHPVRRSLPPLQRRGIALCRTHTTTPSSGADTPPGEGPPRRCRYAQPPRQAELDTPARGAEGNWGAQAVVCGACHPSTGGELAGADTHTPPRQAELDTPPEEGNCSPPEEGNCLVQIRHNHPVKRSLTPLQRKGIPPRQASPDTPPEEGDGSPLL